MEETIGIFAIRTQVGREKETANWIDRRFKQNLGIKAILVPEQVQGYIFIEADKISSVNTVIYGNPFVRSSVLGTVPLKDIEKFIDTKKPIIEGLDEGDTVEIMKGPFRNMRGKITRLDKAKNDIILELLESTFTMPITMSADYVRVVGKIKL